MACEHIRWKHAKGPAVCLRYVSKCGRFIIRKRVYNRPFRFTLYHLLCRGEWFDCDTLVEAKLLAHQFATGTVQRDWTPGDLHTDGMP